MPRPCSPVFLIWLSAMWPQMTPAIDPMNGRRTNAAIDEISETIASTLVFGPAGWP